MFPRLSVLAAVGGWNFGSGPFREVVASQAARRAFVESAIQFLDTWSLDGLDLDWEYPEERERANLTKLIQAARFAFDAVAAPGSAPFLLTAAVPAAKARMGGYDVPAIKDHLDFVNIMAYDLHGPWDKKTGHNAPMISPDGLSVWDGVEMWAEAGMGRGRMVVGMPTYGHSFQLATPWDEALGATAHGGVSGPYTRTSGFFAYYEVCEFLAEEETRLMLDEAGGSLPYAVRNDTWLSYDNENSLRRKVDWVVSQGYGGVMIWSLALDDFTGQVCPGNATFPLLRAINDGLGCRLPEGPLDPDVLRYVTAIRNEPKPWEKKVWWTSTTTTTTTTTTTPRPTTRPPSSGGVRRAGTARKTGVNWELVQERVRLANSRTAASAAAAGGGSSAATSPPVYVPLRVADECDWENDFRRGDNCSHFVRCERGQLHSFICPPGLAFHERDAVCRWPRFVEDCLFMTPPPTTPEPTTEAAPELPLAAGSAELGVEREIHYHFEVLGQPTAEQEEQYQIFTIFADDADAHRSSNNVFSVFRGSSLT